MSGLAAGGQEGRTQGKGTRPAVFLDRDGTLTEPRHYPSHPADLVLQPGVGPALRELQDAGWALVIVTNQSGLARALFSLRDLDVMHRHLRRLVDPFGVRIDGIYVCPHHEDGTIDGLSFRCACRKPGASLLLAAADELGLNLDASWMVGDFASDIAAGRRAGCRTARVGPTAGDEPADPASEPTLRLATTTEALRRIARMARAAPFPSGHRETDRTPHDLAAQDQRHSLGRT